MVNWVSLCYHALDAESVSQKCTKSYNFVKYKTIVTPKTANILKSVYSTFWPWIFVIDHFNHASFLTTKMYLCVWPPMELDKCHAHEIPRGKLLWKKRTKIFGIRKSRQFFSGFWGIWGFFSADFFEIFPIIFFRRTFSEIFCDI